MDKAVYRFLFQFLILSLIVQFSYQQPVQLVYALDELSLEETKKLLQKGLTIHEIDREVERLQDIEHQLQKKIIEIEEQIVEQDQIVKETKQRAGEILRSYYMGDRVSLLMLIITIESFSEALATIEFINMIFSSDQRILNEYISANQQLQVMYKNLILTQKNLQGMKQQFIQQRNTLVTLQSELNLILDNHPESTHLQMLINQLTINWQEIGRPILQTYFKALGEAMNQLPDIQNQYKDIVSFRGTQILFKITDDQLNEFLQSKNSIFENFSFQFYNDQIEVRGEQDGLTATIIGHYKLVNDPENAIQFSIDELIYNGFTLPESTIKTLESEYDLGFYPGQQKFLGFSLQATQLQMEFGSLEILLRIK